MTKRLLEAWRALDLKRRAIFLGAGAVAVAAMLALGSMAARPGMALLYSGLDPATAGEVVGALEQLQVTSDVRGDAIYVPAEQRDRVRLQLARDGIPRQGQAGYELLDRISGFSATTDMFNAAYWRAKEGELARTILATPGVRAARVHIAAPSRRPFSRESAGATASVTVTSSGGALGLQQATAIRYLVALSVAGLDPEHVAVIDSRAGMILAPGATTPTVDASASGADREARLKREIEEMLEARVGRDKVRVSVTVETEREAETITEKVIQPETRVTIHSDTEEISDTSSGAAQGVTIASNLPAGDAAEGTENRSERTESRERVNYDYSEVRRERIRQPGATSRLSVAVLVDGLTVEDGAGGTTWQPRPAEELEALRQLVIAAVGFDESRGDIVTVESMAFQPADGVGELVEVDAFSQFIDRHGLDLVQIGVLAAVVIVLSLTVFRPLLAGSRGTGSTLPAIETSTGSVTGGAQIASLAASDGQALPSEPVTAGLPNREALLRLVNDHPAETTALLREWLDVADSKAA